MGQCYPRAWGLCKYRKRSAFGGLGAAVRRGAEVGGLEVSNKVKAQRFTRWALCRSRSSVLALFSAGALFYINVCRVGRGERGES